jgi:hypothetical protein
MVGQENSAKIYANVNLTGFFKISVDSQHTVSIRRCLDHDERERDAWALPGRGLRTGSMVFGRAFATRTIGQPS